MAILSREILTNLGINLSDSDFDALAQHFEETLDKRVFDEIAYSLEPAQAHELAAMGSASDAEIVSWIQTNVPDFADIVSDEFDIMLGEIAESNAVTGEN